MNWQDLLDNRTVQRHTTSVNEISGLRDLINRDIKDAGIAELSPDRRFATSYNAALQLCKMTIACAGYRISSGPGHHQKAFDIVKLALGPDSENLADYFELCRRKRNDIDYDFAEVVTETEQLQRKAKEFQTIVEAWIKDNYPGYKN
jgi:hypothetical protein